MQFIIYLIRWIISAFVMMPVLFILKDTNKYYSLLIAQIVGALIFYNIDKRIFRDEVSEMRK